MYLDGAVIGLCIEMASRACWLPFEKADLQCLSPMPLRPICDTVSPHADFLTLSNGSKRLVLAGESATAYRVDSPNIESLLKPNALSCHYRPKMLYATIPTSCSTDFNSSSSIMGFVLRVQHETTWQCTRSEVARSAFVLVTLGTSYDRATSYARKACTLFVVQIDEDSLPEPAMQ